MTSSPFHGIFSALQTGSGGSLSDPPSGGFSDDTFSVPPPAGAKDTGRLAVDIYEQDDYYIIRAPIAGVRMSDLDIEVTDNVVTIRGARQKPEPIPESKYYLQECYWGPFSRSVTLPFPVDPKRIRATFNRDCILKVIIPKEEKVKIVRITEG